MALGVGIVGLPNVGKSTLFNALTRAQNAEAANYPFCTIEPNKATVPVADARLDALAKIVNPAQIVKATVDFIDIAGLVRGASKGEGLGNKFLANIRETDAIIQVVRCFADDDVVHVEGGIDPIRDIEIIETELVLADMQSLEKRIDRVGRQARTDKELRKEVEAMEALMKHLDAGQPVRTYPRGEADPIENTLVELQMITDKPVIYCANVGENELDGENEQVARVKAYAARKSCDMVVISAKMEAELAGLSDAERDDFLASYGLKESGPRPDDPHGLPHARPRELFHGRAERSACLDLPPRLGRAQVRGRHPHRLRARLHPRRSDRLRRLRTPERRGRRQSRRRDARRRQRVPRAGRRRHALPLQRLVPCAACL